MRAFQFRGRVWVLDSRGKLHRIDVRSENGECEVLEDFQPRVAPPEVLAFFSLKR